MAKAKTTHKSFSDTKKKLLKEAKKIDFVINLSFTDSEIDKHLLKILAIDTSWKECQKDTTGICPANGYHEHFYRDESGELQTEFRICEKKLQADEDIHTAQNFWISDLPAKYKHIGINKNDVMTIRGNTYRNKLILQIRSQLKEKKYRGFYLHGDMGVGKTYLLAGFANELAKSDKTICFISITNLIEKIKEYFNSGDEGQYEIREIVNKLKTVDVLFLDDFGLEEFSQYFHMTLLLSVFLHRYDNELPTYFVSNRSIEDLTNYYLTRKDFGKKKIDKLSIQKFIDSIKSLTQTRTFELYGKSLRY
ncbi:AFG1/ZapE family ATPase [Ureaplasma ceti]|uniref:ATP-binding protein n=1 Tax=Ureaplasma ceti TaxID=3119530 RepID=A0ABP9U917_9BACT